ncbi:hypothetical protein A2U01_0030304, partial [Trifolium medium]|nr:hypothetical protein [Trifolium medium]
LETFYNGLIPNSKAMLDASSGGDLISKSYTEGFAFIESITANTYQWPTARANHAPAKKTAGIHEVSKITALATQIAQIHNMMKTLMTPLVLPTVQAEPVKVVTDDAEVAFVYCDDGHLFADCPGNPVSVNYVANYSKNNNPYSTTYNPGWKNHPNFSCTAPQNQHKAPAVPPGFAAQGNSQLEKILKNFMHEQEDYF